MNINQNGSPMITNEGHGNPIGLDFTMETYGWIAQLATGFVPASFGKIPWGQNFILFRHDVDVSLNRALSLAKVDAELGLQSTFFIDPLNQFYSVFEPNQRKILFEIIDLGHDLGLHFDSSRHSIETDDDLEQALKFESRVLAKAAAEPVAFSFHNPSRTELRLNQDSYAGLANAYSEKLFTQVRYTSDSNGYWRHTPIADVLSESIGRVPVQVLTHPEWWLDKKMSPRSRIHRAVYGRARNVVTSYDSLLADHGRLNKTGMPPSLESLALLNGAKFQALDILWNMGRLETLFVELWRLHESQINKMCKAQFRKVWGVSAQDVNAFFASDGVRVDGWKLFELVFEGSWLNATGSSETEHRKWVQVRNQLIHARGSIRPSELDAGVSYLSDIIAKLADWGLDSEINYDGVAPLGSIGLPTYKSAEGSLVEELDLAIDSMAEAQGTISKRWRSLKAGVLHKGGMHE
jgi:hypothetical protein